MNIYSLVKPLMLTSTFIIIGCTAVPARYTGAEPVRERLSNLESNQKIGHLAPMAIKDARTAVLNAEHSQKEVGLSEHLVIIAERKVDIAEAESQLRYLEEQRSELKSQRDGMQLEARTNESRRAKFEANQAKDEAMGAQRQATQAQNEAAQAQQDALLAQSEAKKAQQNLNEAEQKTANAKLQVQDMQRQLDELDAKNTARGAVVTLGDVLFDFNKSDIKEGAISHLAKLAAFLNNNPDRNAIIEGHTDNVGSNEVNMVLSQRRADAVEDYLMSQGVAQQRLSSSGKGELLPITDNASTTKRQQNRRVEVIISNPVR